MKKIPIFTQHCSRKMSQLVVILIAGFLLPAFNVQAMKNPAVVYCISMGYKYIENVSGNNQCQIPSSGETFSEWDFYNGKVGQKYGYCALHGYEIKTINSKEICPPFSPDHECAVCIIGGKAVVLADAMKLDFRDAPCGDGKCSPLETYMSCSKDCPSGVADGVCDGTPDGKCDPDCTQIVTYAGAIPKPDPDCKPVVLDVADNSSSRIDYKAVAALILGGIIAISLVLCYLKKRLEKTEPLNFKKPDQW
ncbi:MAG: DUF333 domain-containing protein [Candidatus Moraniibacteriota bacterium]